MKTGFSFDASFGATALAPFKPGAASGSTSHQQLTMQRNIDTPLKKFDALQDISPAAKQEEGEPMDIDPGEADAPKAPQKKKF